MQTRYIPFCPTTSSDDSAHLFAVREGISVEAAIEQAGAMLDAGLETMRSLLVDMDRNSMPLWSAFYNFEAVHALLESVVLAVGDSDQEADEPLEPIQA